MRPSEENTQQPVAQRSPLLLGLLSGVIMIVVTLLILEAGLRLIGYGDPGLRRDPFFDFDGAPPVYHVSDESGQGQHYVPRQNMADISRTFPVRKPSDGYRVFAFGGSTTYGQPYGNEGGFPNFMEQSLRAFYPDKPIDVINVGVKGFGSSRVLQIVEEMVEYEPDLFVVYMGQNEYRDAGFHYWELHRSPLTASLLGVLLQSRALYLIHEGYIGLESWIFGRRLTTVGASLIESILLDQDVQQGFESFDYYSVPVVNAVQPVAGKTEDDLPGFKEHMKLFIKNIFRRGYMHMSGDDIEENYRLNVSRIMQVAKEHDIHIVFLELSSNPKSRSLISLDILNLPQEFLETFPQEAWSSHYAAGLDKLRNADYKQAADSLEAARELLADQKDRTLQIFLGEAYAGEGHYAQARAAYVQRLSPDTASLNAIIRLAGTLNNVPVLDVTKLFQDNAENGIIGYENYFVDSIHMSIEGYRLIGYALAVKLMREGILPASDVAVDAVARKIEAIQPEQTALVASSLGWAAFNQGKIEQARLLGERALVLDPEDIGAHVLLGYVYTRLKNHEAAQATRAQLERLYVNMPK